jgi:hypothetical protein
MKYLDLLEPSKSQARTGIIALLVFQANFVSTFETILIVPCYPASANIDVGMLTPSIEINGKAALVLMHQISAVQKKALKGAVIGNAMCVRDSLIRAIDLLVTGF